MSDKLRKSLPNKDSHIITEPQFDFLKSLETMQRSNNYYFQRLITQYLKDIADELGYDSEANLEFNLDLNTDTRELTIKEAPLPDGGLPEEPPLHG